MTDDRLDHIEWQFRNPPSAAAMADLGLELVEALRAERRVKPAVIVPDAPIMQVIDEQHFGGAVDKHAAPTPPLREKRKAK